MKKKIIKAKELYDKLPLQVKTSFWVLICTFLQRGISVITTPIFTRLLTTEEYGLFSTFDSWLNIITVFVTLKLAGGVYVQGMVKFEDEQNVFSSSLQGLTLTLSAVWTIIYFVFQEVWNALFSITTVQALAMLVMMWATAAFELWTQEKRILLKYRMLVIVTIFASLAKPIVGIIFVLNANDKVTARILGLALVELVAYSGCFFAQMKRGKKFYSKNFWLYALSFNIPLIPHYLSQTALNSADRIMIKTLVGSSEAGIYNLAYSISKLVSMFISALNATLSPWIYQRIKRKEYQRIPKMTYSALLVIAVMNMLLIAFAPEIIKIFAPSDYLDAVWIVPPVAMSTLFTFAYGQFSAFEFYYKKVLFVSFASVTGALLNIILNYIFIPIFGYYAAGYTTLVCYIVYSLLHFLFMKYVCKEKLNGVIIYRTRTIWLILFICTIFGCLMTMTYTHVFLRYSFIAILIVLLFTNRNRILGLVVELRDN